MGPDGSGVARSVVEAGPDLRQKVAGRRRAWGRRDPVAAARGGGGIRRWRRVGKEDGDAHAGHALVRPTAATHGEAQGRRRETVDTGERERESWDEVKEGGEKKEKKTDMQVPRLAVGIEYEIQRMTGEEKLRIEKRILMTG